MRQQHTISRSVSCSGVGLHTGQPISLTLNPAPPDTGILFVCHQEGRTVSFGASIRNLMSTDLCTALSANGTLVKTVEHLLAALVGLEVDNVYVELDGGEIPAMDGSASAFVRLIRSAGITPQERPQPYLKILRPIEISEGGRRVAIAPAATTKITCSVEYNHPMIQQQTYEYDWSVASFEQDIADARTFAFLKEVEALWARGLAKGGSLDNTVVLSEDGIVNESGLRFENEFVRHKVLDLIGDMALLGVPVIGHLTADRSGHALHSKLVQAILSQPDSWVLLNAQEEAVAPQSIYARPAHKPAVALQAASAA
ncbi:MAG: UDP-3-O-acyl-N-acetylglucosamine deacetylase [Nitrospirota bacterium]|nr:UDP-3-O-acyl-N-acetylglucosamine deacetylase [Nitrospirota bacterium]MDE3243457.1 UDP-3-O-acyl-N-acetylglucosamine deacetylase [Nitrospirota bacterium]